MPDSRLQGLVSDGPRRHIAAMDEAPEGLDDVETWIFDLDNTLYPISKKLLADIDRHMGKFIAGFLNIDRDEARRVQKTYFRRYGLTMRGLMIHHGLDPARFFEQMEPIDLEDIDPNPALADAIRRLGGRKMIYTNASVRHAAMVLARLGMDTVFGAVFDIAAADYIPKPSIEAYHALCRAHQIDPTRAVMIDDIARNLEPAAEIGMTTVWIKTDAEWARSVDDTAHINFATSDLLAWLADVPPSN